MENILVKCAHCEDLIIINKKDFNCKIFRHGVYKSNNEQIDSHLCKEECDRLFNEGLIYGCGNIGSRHAQGAIQVNKKTNIYIYDIKILSLKSII